MSAELDPAQIMARHTGRHDCHNMARGDWNPEEVIQRYFTDRPPEYIGKRGNCPTYRLAEALAAERARVQRVEALALRWERGVGTSGRSSEQLRAALAGDTEGKR